MQFLCLTSQLATPYPLRLPGTAWSLHQAGGREGRGEPRSGFLQDTAQRPPASRELYLWNPWTGPRSRVSWYPGHWSPLCQTRGLISPKPRPQNDIRFGILRNTAVYCDIVNIGCWKLQTWAVGTEIYWSDFINSSLPNIFRRIVSNGVLELIQKNNEISWNKFL